MKFFEDTPLDQSLKNFDDRSLTVGNLLRWMSKSWLDDQCMNCGVDVIRVSTRLSI